MLVLIVSSGTSKIVSVPALPESHVTSFACPLQPSFRHGALALSAADAAAAWDRRLPPQPGAPGFPAARRRRRVSAGSRPFAGGRASQRNARRGGFGGADAPKPRLPDLVLQTANCTAWGSAKLHLRSTRADVVCIQETRINPAQGVEAQAWARRNW